MNKDKLKELFKRYDIDLDDKKLSMFEIFYNDLIETNKVMNLTAITEEYEVFVKHFLDSAIFEKLIAKNENLIDVGTGAGFPSVPLKIVRDDLKITMLDSLNKRINFLNGVISKLNLKNVVAVHDRCEDFAKKNFEKFDIATSRAVAKIATLSEYLLPLVKLHGKVLMLKSGDFEEELNEGKFAIETLGGKIISIKKYKIENIDRAIIVIEKIKHTNPKYPRGKNLPKTKPLIKD